MDGPTVVHVALSLFAIELSWSCIYAFRLEFGCSKPVGHGSWISL
jgi:hypothetical protein